MLISHKATTMERLEIKRQLFHTVNGTIILLLFERYGKPIGLILLILSIVGAILSLYHVHVKPIKLAQPFVEALERKENIKFPGKGAILYGLGVSLSIIFFPKKIALASIAALAYGDSSSTIFGKLYGKRRYPWNKKLSIEGSVAFIVSTATIGTLFVPFQIAFISGIIGAMAETIPHIDDNISIPLSVCLVLSLILKPNG